MAAPAAAVGPRGGGVGRRARALGGAGGGAGRGERGAQAAAAPGEPASIYQNCSTLRVHLAIVRTCWRRRKDLMRAAVRSDNPHAAFYIAPKQPVAAVLRASVVIARAPAGFLLIHLL